MKMIQTFAIIQFLTTMNLRWQRRNSRSEVN